MKVTIHRVSNWDYEDVREWATLDDMLAFIDECGRELIIDREFSGDGTQVTIYDDYME